MGSGTTHPQDESSSTVSTPRVTSVPCDPLTDGPNRKRAKTEDEKEQRRIERVLRNRQAAQSSRERKRQEVEKLEGEKHEIELQNQRLKERLMAVEHEKFLLAQQVNQLTAEMYAATGRKPPSLIATAPGLCTPAPSLRADSLSQQSIKLELDDPSFALPTPQKSIDVSLFSSPSPSSGSLSPSPSDIGSGLGALDPPSDMTQHPAAMLCGLQCQSEAAWAAPCPRTIRPYRWRATSAPFLCLTLASLIYSRLLPPLHLIFRSLRTGSPLPSGISPRATPMIFLLINWLISTPANLIPATTTSSSTTTTPATRPHPSITPSAPLPSARRPIFRLRLLRRLLFCSPALARPLKDATSEAMRTGTSRGRTGSSTDSLRGGKRKVDENGGGGTGTGHVGDGHETGPGHVVRSEQVMMRRAVKMVEKELGVRRRVAWKTCIINRRKRS